MKKPDIAGLGNIYDTLGQIQRALIMHIDEARDVPFEHYEYLMDASQNITKSKDKIGDYIEHHHE